MADDWRKFFGDTAMAPGLPASNVPQPEGITPAPDTSGLYAIYGKKNPYSAEANRYSAMAGMDMGGRLGQLPGIVATALAGRAAKKSEAFEKERGAKIDAFLARKEAYDKIKNDRDARQSNAKYLSETVFPAAQQEYARVLTESKDMQAASAAASQVANKMAADQGIPAPEVVAFNAWKGASSMSVINDKGKTTTAIYKDGAMLVQNDKGDFEPPNEKWLSLKDAASMLDSQARQQKSQTSGLKGKEHIYLTPKGELITSTDPEAARKQGANRVMMDSYGEDGFRTTKEFFLPGMAPADEAPAAEAAPQAEQPSQPGMISRGIKAVGNAISGRPGGVARAAASMGGPVPGGQPAAAAPQGQPVRRATPDGRIALFDASTKQFLRWE